MGLKPETDLTHMVPDNIGGGDRTYEETVKLRLEGLSHTLRRRTVIALREHEGEKITLDQLAREIDLPEDCTIEDGTSLSGVLRHRHIPTLEKTGMVQFYPNENKVLYSGDELTDGLLDAIDSARDSSTS